MISRIDHAGITVADLERSLAFYHGLLGFDVQATFERDTEDIGRIVGYPGASLKIAMLHIPGGAVRLELLQYVTPEGAAGPHETCDPGVGHICFVVDDVQGAYDRLAAAGIDVRSDGPVEITQGPHRGALVLYLRDPDGYTVELSQPAPAH
jgi:catechol 2,3-dioxygenase-like lactoylglutathione lyase family enzyme